MKKPFIGFEPMTYALPWRYSTTELKGPYSIYELAIFSMSLLHICSRLKTQNFIYLEIESGGKFFSVLHFLA